MTSQAATLVESRSPHDHSDLIVSVPDADRTQVEQAVSRSQVAAQGWARTPASERSTALTACSRALEDHSTEMAELIVREVGKPLLESRGEVARAAAILNYYAQLALLPDGEMIPPSDGMSMLFTRRRPHGVAGLITPWNFPLAIPLWKAAPALAFGNTVVLKPAEQSPATALLLSELFDDLLPRDVLQVVTGRGHTGAAVVALTDVVSFTGSTTTGNEVRRAATEHSVPVQCEMGGQNASIVLADANQDGAAAAIAYAAMGFAGQKCTATSRAIVVGDASDFAQRLTAAVQQLGMGDPADAANLVGPVIDSKARDAVLTAVASAKDAGAAIHTGGSAINGPGSYVAPVVVSGLPDAHQLLTEEVFGPVCAVMAASSLEHAVELNNSVRHGLVAALFTRDLNAALTTVPQLAVGMVKINQPTSGVDFHAPFGGDKESSFGAREQGTAARDFYTSTMTVTMGPTG